VLDVLVLEALELAVLALEVLALEARALVVLVADVFLVLDTFLVPDVLVLDRLVADAFLALDILGHDTCTLVCERRRSVVAEELGLQGRICCPWRRLGRYSKRLLAPQYFKYMSSDSTK
jgi:hypothetical protein